MVVEVVTADIADGEREGSIGEEEGGKCVRVRGGVECNLVCKYVVKKEKRLIVQSRYDP